MTINRTKGGGGAQRLLTSEARNIYPPLQWRLRRGTTGEGRRRGFLGLGVGCLFISLGLSLSSLFFLVLFLLFSLFISYLTGAYIYGLSAHCQSKLTKILIGCLILLSSFTVSFKYVKFWHRIEPNIPPAKKNTIYSTRTPSISQYLFYLPYI